MLINNTVYQIMPVKEGIVVSTDDIYDSVIDKVFSNKEKFKFKENKGVYIKTLSFDNENDKAEVKIIKGKDKGKIKTIDAKRLQEVDMYPRFMFSPDIWLSKANSNMEVILSDVEEKLEEALANEEVQLAIMEAKADDTKTPRVLDKVRNLLKPYFGGFLLALVIGYIGSKIIDYTKTKRKTNKDYKFSKLADVPKLKG